MLNGTKNIVVFPPSTSMANINLNFDWSSFLSFKKLGHTLHSDTNAHCDSSSNNINMLQYCISSCFVIAVSNGVAQFGFDLPCINNIVTRVKHYCITTTKYRGHLI